MDPLYCSQQDLSEHVPSDPLVLELCELLIQGQEFLHIPSVFIHVFANLHTHTCACISLKSPCPC